MPIGEPQLFRNCGTIESPHLDRQPLGPIALNYYRWTARTVEERKQLKSSPLLSGRFKQLQVSITTNIVVSSFVIA